MKILVLGGGGFIGAHVVDSLISAGHHVRVFDRSVGNHSSAQIEHFQTDFNDILTLSEALESVDVVIHLISTSVPSTSNKDPISDINGNLINTVRLLDMMRQSGVDKIIYFSSGGTIYGKPLSLPTKETEPTNPICSYGVIKLAIEKYLNMYTELYGFTSCVLRPSNPYGSGQRHIGVQGFIGTCINKAIDGSTLTIWGDGSVVRDYIHVSDVASATLAAVQNMCSGTYNISSSEGYSLNEIINIVEKVSGKEINVEYQAGRGFDLSKIVLDNSKAKIDLSWSIQTDIFSGIEMTYSDITKLSE